MFASQRNACDIAFVAGILDCLRLLGHDIEVVDLEI